MPPPVMPVPVVPHVAVAGFLVPAHVVMPSLVSAHVVMPSLVPANPVIPALVLAHVLVRLVMRMVVTGAWLASGRAARGPGTRRGAGARGHGGPAGRNPGIHRHRRGQDLAPGTGPGAH